MPLGIPPQSLCTPLGFQGAEFENHGPTPRCLLVALRNQLLVGSRRNIGVPGYPQLPHSLCFQLQHSGGPGCPYVTVPGGPHIRHQRRQPSVSRNHGRFQSGLQAGVRAAKPRRRLLEVMGELGTKGGAQSRESSSATFISQLSRMSSRACPAMLVPGPLHMSARDYGPAHLSLLLAKCTPHWDFYLIVTLSSILFTERLL